MFDIFYLDQPTGLFPHERKANSVEDAAIQSRTSSCWIVNYLCDYTGFDFLYQPLPHQRNQVHVWPSQHQANSGTWLIPRQPGQLEVNRDHSAIIRTRSAPRVHIKHNPDSPDLGNINVRYINDYLGTMKRSLSKVNAEYCWVTADVCDYTDFDFTWHPDEWQLDMLHVFSSNDQKFGDTFYVHVPSFLAKTQDLKILEWFETLHFVEDTVVNRPAPVAVKYTTDSIVPAVWSHEFKAPVVQFYHTQPVAQPPTISLWQEKTKTVIPLSTDAGTALIPRECKNYLKTQVYDYPYIDKTHKINSSPVQDIVYISYDEPEAEINYEKLITRFPRAQRVHGVNGMENALLAAADVSTTPWYFAVFAKTQLASEFNFDFVPDYFQEKKHYIFNARNRVNGLVYGHMGIILYNCALVNTADEYNKLGLDYTLSFPHETVPIISCHGVFDVSPYHTWRTSFRECAKLKYFNSLSPDLENQHRLRIWSTQADGPYAKWALAGANDGIEFCQEVDYQLDQLKHSFRWEWLRQRFVDRYGDLE